MLKLKWNIFFLIATFCLISISSAQLFNAKEPPTNLKPGINKVPPLMPVMSAGEFQGKVKTLSDQNRKAMTDQGFNTIQKQLDALPAIKPDAPEPSLPVASNPTNTSNGNTNNTAPSQTPETAAPPAQAPEETTPEAGNTENGTSATEPSQSYSGFAATPGSSPNTPPPTGGQLNIQY